MVGITGFATHAFTSFTEHLAGLPATEAIIFDIAIILVISTIFAFLAKILKQPLIPAYVLTGLFLGPVVLGIIRNLDLIYAFSEIGIAFLLFTAGLEISFKKIKEANLKKISLIGTAQIFAVFILTLLLAGFFSLSIMQAVYIGIMLAFGSTMVVIKLLSDSNELVTMHGRLVLGILLLQDLFAIIAISLLTSGSFSVLPILVAFGKLFSILIIAFVLQRYVLNKFFRFAAKSTELLLLTSLSVLFLFIMISYFLELSIVIGAFIAGVSLANSPFKLELESRISPIRDFFSILFFVALGIQIVFTGISQRLDLFVGLLVISFLVKPFFTIAFLRMGGYRPRTSFLTGISLAQLSEFSLIIGMLGVSLGVLDMSLFSTVILATIVSMAVTTYFIKYKNQIYAVFRKPMDLFKLLPIKENLIYLDKEEKKILVVGAHRVGSVVLKDLIKHHRKKLLVIDYNPELINALIKKKVSCIYGDLGSPELLNNVDIKSLTTVISTAPADEDNTRLIKKIREKNKDAKIIVTGYRISEALELYNKGADFVVLPKMVAGEEIKHLANNTKKELTEKKRKHLRKLEKMHRLLY